MKLAKELILIYPSRSEKMPVDADFYSMCAFLQDNGITYRCWYLNMQTRGADGNVTVTPEELAGIKNIPVYFHLSELTYLGSLHHILPEMKRNSPLIIAGGNSAVTIEAADILENFPGIDIIAKTPETEKALVNILQHWHVNGAWKDTPGIIQREKSHDSKPFSMRATSNPPLSNNLDHLSSLEMIKQNIPAGHWYPIITSKGCSYKCRYCGFQLPYQTGYIDIGDVWRKKSVDKVVDEMEFLVANNINRFLFHCHQFFEPAKSGSQTGYAEKIAREILNRKLKIEFTFSAKPPDLIRNTDALFLLREAGMNSVNIGIDSGSEHFHRLYNTGTTLEDNYTILEFFHKHRFNFDISFILFEPYLDIPGLKENLVFLEDIGKYFSHLDMPYSGYLDSRVLNSVLILRYGMPIIEKLKTDNLLSTSTGFTRQPATGLKDPQTNFVYSVLKHLYEKAMPYIRGFYYNKKLTTDYPYVNRFPLTLLENIVSAAADNRITEIQEEVSIMEGFIKDTFAKDIPGMLANFNSAGNSRNNEITAWFNI